MDVVFEEAMYGGPGWLLLPCLTTIVTVLQSRAVNGRDSWNGSARLPLPGLAFEEPATTVEILLRNRGPAIVQVLSAELPPPDHRDDEVASEGVLRGTARLVGPGEAVVYRVRPRPSPPPGGFDLAGGSLAIYPRPMSPQAERRGREPFWSAAWRRLRSRALRVLRRA